MAGAKLPEKQASLAETGLKAWRAACAAASRTASPDHSSTTTPPAATFPAARAGPAQADRTKLLSMDGYYRRRVKAR